jgi:hypothetical protein
MELDKNVTVPDSM